MIQTNLCLIVLKIDALLKRLQINYFKTNNA